jgi:hypothetical protein
MKELLSFFAAQSQPSDDRSSGMKGLQDGFRLPIQNELGKIFCTFLCLADGIRIVAGRRPKMTHVTLFVL